MLGRLMRSEAYKGHAEVIAAWPQVQATPPALFNTTPPSDEALASDPTAWMPLVLWAQALVLAAIGLTWARLRWGARQAWLVGVPTLAALGLAVADQVARLLPNLM